MTLIGRSRIEGAAARQDAAGVDVRPAASAPVRHTVAATDFTLDSIDLYITSLCNRRCSYCFLPDSFFAAREHMPPETVAAIVDWARGAADEVTLLGGEPALHPAFAQIVAATAAAPIRVRTVTNGSRRFRAALRDDGVRAALHRVAVSIDAPSAAIVDQLRGPGAFADALATLADLRQAGIPFDLNCTIVAAALDSVPEMLAFAEDAGADRLNMHWYSPVGRGRVHAAEQAVSPPQWRTRVLDVVAGYRPRRAGFVADCQLAFAYGLPGEDRRLCAVRDRTNLQFLPSGAVFACGMLVEDEALSGYRWEHGTLVTQPGSTELHHAGSGCPGCPVRRNQDGLLPVCIYNRLALT